MAADGANLPAGGPSPVATPQRGERPARGLVGVMEADPWAQAAADGWQARPALPEGGDGWGDWHGVRQPGGL